MRCPLDDDIVVMLERFRTVGGASPVTIRDVEEALGVMFPQDYSALLQWSNGGEGPVGESGYLQLWPVDQIESINNEYSVRSYLPNVIAIGTDLGGNAYLIDFGGAPRFASVDFVNLHHDAIVPLGTTVAEFVRAIGHCGA
jgi:SMI1 / KNR4 family (SUKH-1)